MQIRVITPSGEVGESHLTPIKQITTGTTFQSLQFLFERLPFLFSRILRRENRDDRSLTN